MSRVLEIGYGSRPAVNEGTLFCDRRVTYFGVELPHEFEGSFARYQIETPEFPAITADMAALPFADESFSHVLLRSVYGQFKSRPEIIDNVRMGIYEAVRVLEPGGTMVVAEENTPKGTDYIGRDLTGAGLIIKACHEMEHEWEDMPLDDPWKKARSKYYSGRPALAGRASCWFACGSLTIAEKPEDLQLREVYTLLGTDFYKPVNERSREGRELTFRVPVKELQAQT
jgi:hypothetical protein